MDNQNQNEELKEDELDGVAGGSRRAQVLHTDDECEPGDCLCDDECEEDDGATSNTSGTDAAPGMDSNDVEIG